jgi:hypothetical protein
MFFPPESEETGPRVCSALCRAGVSYTEKRKYRLFHDGWCACHDTIRHDAKYYDEIGQFAWIKFVDEKPSPPLPDSIAHMVRIEGHAIAHGVRTEGQTVHNVLNFSDELEKYKPRSPSLLDKLDKLDPGYPSFLAKYNAIQRKTASIADDIAETIRVDTMAELLKGIARYRDE